DGNQPDAVMIYVNGNLYGTTNGGGTNGLGTVFEVSTSGGEKALYSFAGGNDGSGPQSPLVELKGQLYGTTYQGGGTGCSGSGCGTIFTLTP
ncbi:MAG TPA: choice-of-anchor tandem repeat GloVer-containing protein, partial [Candidatus Tumulicola sp.]